MMAIAVEVRPTVDKPQGHYRPKWKWYLRMVFRAGGLVGIVKGELVPYAQSWKKRQRQTRNTTAIN